MLWMRIPLDAHFCVHSLQNRGYFAAYTCCLLLMLYFRWVVPARVGALQICLHKRHCSKNTIVLCERHYSTFIKDLQSS